MRRHRTTSRKPAKTRHGSTTKPKRNNARKTARRADSRVADLQEQVSALTRELAEAREQQTATSEILGVIAASPTNIRPVLQAIAENACRLCEAYDSVIYLREGDRLRGRAHHGAISILGGRSTAAGSLGAPSLIGNRCTCKTFGMPPTSSPTAASARAASVTGPLSAFPC